MNIFFTCFFICLIDLMTAQSCLPDGITFSTQEAIDNFPSDYPGCSEILGPVTIDGNQIQNLLGLSSIIEAGQLQISNTQITSFQGLHNMHTVAVLSVHNNSGLDDMEGLNSLDSVSFLINIDSNVNLVNLQGLGSLRYMQNVFNIRNNPQLENLSGLDVFEYAGGFAIQNNASLQNFTGMPLLTEIGNLVNIINNDALLNFEGFENVHTITGSMEVSNNGALISFAGWTGLQSIFGDINVFQNQSLQSFDGLENLIHIESELSIVANPMLTDITAFDNLVTVNHIRISSNNQLQSLGDFTNLDPVKPWNGFLATGNPVLSDCATVAFCGNSNLQQTHLFQNNATGCNSKEEVLASCLVGTHDPAKYAGIDLFPNPAVDLVEIKGLSLNQEFVVSIYSQNGIRLYEYELREPYIDITTLHPGLYFMALSGMDYKVFSKFVKL